MRAALALDGGRDSYLAYLVDVQQQMRGIEAEAAAMGIAAKDIPKVLGRPMSSLPKMIDEYYWLTLTRGLARAHRAGARDAGTPGLPPAHR